jgi:putative hemolysin
VSNTPTLLAVSFTGTDAGLLGAVVVLIIGSAVLALAETGLTRTTRAKAKALEDAGHRGAKSLRKLAENPEEFLAPVLLIVLLCQLVAATLVGVVAAHLFGALGVAVATVFEVVVIFVFGEAVPKQWAVRHADRAALFAAPFVSALVGFPPIRVVSSGLIGLARLITPGHGDSTGSDVTESELLAFTDVAVEDEAIESGERQLIHSIIEFGDTIVREVMVPRPDVVAVDGAIDAETVLERAIEAGFSRIPVYEGNVDDVVGIAFTKDLVRAVRHGEERRPVAELARPAQYVPETKRVAPLLREMQAGQFHLAVVIDEYGGTAGVVTLEDLIEELVGEIADEFDVEEPLVEPLGGGQFRVSSKMPVDEVNELLDATLPLSDDWDTIGGLVMALAGHVPSEGETVEVDGHLLVAEKVQGRRVGAVRLLNIGGAPLRLDSPSAERAGPDLRAGRGAAASSGAAGAGASAASGASGASGAGAASGAAGAASGATGAASDGSEGGHSP